MFFPDFAFLLLDSVFVQYHQTWYCSEGRLQLKNILHVTLKSWTPSCCIVIKECSSKVFFLLQCQIVKKTENT